MSDPDGLGWLLDAASGARLEDLPDLAAAAMARFGARDVVTYVVDYRQTCLVALSRRGGGPVDPLLLDATVAGRAYTTLSSQEASSEDGFRLWLPIFNGADRLGVIEVSFDDAPTDAQRAQAIGASRLLAEMLSSRRAHGDAVELARRLQPMLLAGEMAWSILPPLTLVADQVSVAGVLEPSYEVGGDSFDYALNGDRLHVALFDAVGHGIGASSLSGLTMSAYRNARRCGLDLLDTARSIDEAIRAQARPADFVTAILAELDVTNGVYRRASAGHPGELLVRDGKVIKSLTAPTGLPLGLSQVLDRATTVDEESLQPGDAIVIYSDGLVDARTEAGEVFGLDRLADFVVRAFADALPAAETMRKLARAVVEYAGDQLGDDATAVLIRWRSEATML